MGCKGIPSLAAACASRATMLQMSSGVTRKLWIVSFIVALSMCIMYCSQFDLHDPLPFPSCLSPTSVAPSANYIHNASHRNFHVEWRVPKAVSLFPENEPNVRTTEKDVESRAFRVQRLFPCYGGWGGEVGANGTGKGARENAGDLYDFVILPIGCFGDTLRACTSCLLGETLVNATYCGRKRLGLFLGDNFYPYGIRHSHDRRFQEELHVKFFRHPRLQFRYYATSGNHDERPKFLYRTDRFWTMPAPFYRSGVQKSGDTTLEIFVISTNPYHTKSRRFCTAQRRWLDAALKGSTARWKILITHEPILDVFHNHPRNDILQEIHVLLVQHGVQLLVCAHIHGVFLNRIEGGYYQLISAGFTRNLMGLGVSTRPLGYSHSGVGATALLFKPNVVKVVAVDAKGYLIFQHDVFHKISSC